ncbi:MAG: DUF1963 domain-containing protein [Clostridia bacterium]|nr:DUF1963 domain-containing protein [Clostridia bacterium]
MKKIILLLSLSILFYSVSAEKGDVPTMRTLKDVEETLASFGLSEYREEISKLAKGSIHIALMPESDENIPIGASKMGGMPDLPFGTNWLRHEFDSTPLSFICQIDFAEVKPYDKENKLPDHGMLYFFYDCSEKTYWGCAPNDSSDWTVFYFDGDTSQLARRPVPDGIIQEGFFFKPARMCFDDALDLPDLYSSEGKTLTLSDDCRHKYLSLTYKEAPNANKLLGHSDNIQFCMEEECEKETGKTGPWDLLLQVDSNKDCNMMWGDVGRLYLWITDEDLAARNFESVWVVMQCY